MVQKLKINMILIELVFLTIVVGGSAVVYSVFAPWYYSRQKAKVIQSAYAEVKMMDMKNLGEEDLNTFKSYEADNLSFTLCDENYQPVYTTSKRVKEQIYKNIVVNKGSFSKSPKVITDNMRGPESLRLLGRFRQDSVRYYICIKEKMTKIFNSFLYTEHFLVFVVVLALLVGSVVMYWQSRRISKPIEQLAKASERIAARDFSARVKEYHTCQEINSLACNFNTMASQLQYYVEKLEHGANALEQDNALLQEENLRRENLDKMRKEFVANASHELKTPLAVIASHVEMLQLLSDQVDREYYFQSIREEVDKMSDMVGDLLNISSLEHEMESMEKEALDLAETVRYMMLRYNALFEQKKLKVKADIDSECMVMGNRQYLEQVLNNYMMNAFDHTGDGGRLEVSLKKLSGEVKFSVYNEGSHIPPENLDKIWESYYQGRKNDNHAGLGLYIVKTIIENLGGKYGAVNERRGVAFWFTLVSVRG